MTDMSIEDVDELTAVEQLLQRQRERLINNVAEHTERRIRQEIAHTDWQETQVLDVIERTPKPASLDAEDITTLPVLQVVRYSRRGRAPETGDVYGSQLSKPTVYRITEQICYEIGVDPETGFDE
jgi:hypothetical protein